jgi:hypothetical protein
MSDYTSMLPPTRYYTEAKEAVNFADYIENHGGRERRGFYF